MSAENALKTKEKGNALFKEGKIASSAKLYTEAEKLDPKNAVYPFNLSAALYELGDYAAAFHTILRSNALNPEPPVALKLSTRLAKTLSHGLRNGSIQPSIIEQNLDIIRKIENASTSDTSENEHAWKLWRSTTLNLDMQADLTHDARIKLSQMPIYKAPPDPKVTYFRFGMDEIISLVQGWGPAYPDPMDIENLSRKQLKQLAFFMGGVGDARHVYGTIIGLGGAYSKLGASKKKDMKVHMTLNDVHYAPLARDLVHLFIIDKLLSPNLDELVRLELEATLVCSYVAWLVPGYVHDHLVALAKEIKQKLTADPPNMPSWIHVEKNSIEPIIRALDRWSKKTNQTTKELLERVKHVPGSVQLEEALEFRRAHGLSCRDVLGEDRRDAEKFAELPDGGLMDLLGGPNENTLELVLLKRTSQGKKQLVDFLMKALMDKVLIESMVWEERWYRDVGALVPHGGLVERGKHPGFEYFKDVATKKGPHTATTTKLGETVRKTWKPNPTVFDSDDYPKPNTLNDLEFITKIVAFNHVHKLKITNLRAKREWPAFAHVMMFFGGVMDTLKSMKGQLKVEILCGEINSELTKMRLGTDDTRPSEFPRKFTRMWVSNIPDYTHGTLGTAIYMLPTLQDSVPSSVSSNCLANSGAWRTDDEYCFNFTMLLPRDLERYLGAHVISFDAAVGIVTLAPTTLPRPLTSLASREELHTWLGRLLLSILCPGKPQPRPMFVIHTPFNLTAYIQLLVELRRIGYPSHWLADFMHLMMNGTMLVDHLTYKADLPRPLSDLTTTTERHRVRLDPWYAELEAILVRTRHALPFAIQLPDNFASTPDDIGLFRARPPPNDLFGPRYDLPQTRSVSALLFYKTPTSLHPRGVDDFLSQTLTSLVDGKIKTPEPGSVHIVTIVENVDLNIPEVRWRMSKVLVEKMKKEGWSMVVWRTDLYMKTTDGVEAKNWELVL